MGRIARVVIPGLPHHVTQRGNRRQQTFFCDQDYRGYLALMGDWCRRCGVGVWAYCLMPNHAHLIVVPQTQDGLRRGIGEAHRRYTLAVNTRQRWTGHLWQGRFASVVMDETHLIAAARYIELNPVARSSWARPRTGRGPAPPRTWPAKRTSLRTRVGSASASPDGFAPVRIPAPARPESGPTRPQTSPPRSHGAAPRRRYVHQGSGIPSRPQSHPRQTGQKTKEQSARRSVVPKLAGKLVWCPRISK